MLPSVQPSPQSLAAYRHLLGPEQRARIAAAAAPLRGLRVVHLNATAAGGGVAEILNSLIPLLRSVGVEASWQVLPPDPAFFGVTKRLHNWLQGKAGRLSQRDRDTYLAYSARVAPELRDQ